MNIIEVSELWLEANQRSWRPETYRHYKSVVRNHIVPLYGDIDPSGLSKLDVIRSLNGKSPQSANDILKVLKLIYKEAVSGGIVAYNKIASIKPVKIDRTSVVTFTPDEISKLISVASGDVWWRAYLLLEASLGARTGEICGLRWSDIDEEIRTLKIERQASSNGSVNMWTKSKAGTRTLPLIDVVYESLCDLRSANTQLGWYSSDSYIFSRKGGIRCMPRTVQRLFHELLDVAGVPDRVPHVMRHTCATLLLRRGAAFDVVSRLLGHSGVSVTIDIYRNVSQPEMRGAASLIGDVIPVFRNEGT